MPKLLYRGAERLAKGHELLGGVVSLTSGLVVGNIRIRLSFTAIFMKNDYDCELKGGLISLYSVKSGP